MYFIIHRGISILVLDVPLNTIREVRGLELSG
jgi:hypothetical protein